MFSHIMLGASNLEKSKKFYEAFLGALGCQPGHTDSKGRTFWQHEGNTLCLTSPINGQPVTYGNGCTFGFNAASPEQVNAAHAAGVSAGGTTCEDPPGLRPNAPGGPMYLAYLRDPDEHKLCLMHRPPKTAA